MPYQQLRIKVNMVVQCDGRFIPVASYRAIWHRREVVRRKVRPEQACGDGHGLGARSEIRL